MGAYGPGELRGYRDWYAGGGYLHQLKELSPLVGGQVAVAGWYEVGRMYGSSSGSRRSPFRCKPGGRRPVNLRHLSGPPFA